jgi:hypothetical protein
MSRKGVCVPALSLLTRRPGGVVASGRRSGAAGAAQLSG